MKNAFMFQTLLLSHTPLWAVEKPPDLSMEATNRNPQALGVAYSASIKAAAFLYTCKEMPKCLLTEVLRSLCRLYIRVVISSNLWSRYSDGLDVPGSISGVQNCCFIQSVQAGSQIQFTHQF
jgi:hypothetical protein